MFAVFFLYSSFVCLRFLCFIGNEIIGKHAIKSLNIITIQSFGYMVLSIETIITLGFDEYANVRQTLYDFGVYLTSLAN